MKITITTRGVARTDSIQAHVERRLHFALDRVALHITKVDVWLTDVNGPRGGTDQRCRVLVGLRDGGSVVVQETAANPRAAVDRAVARAKRLVKEHRSRKGGAPRRRRTIRDPRRAGLALVPPEAPDPRDAA